MSISVMNSVWKYSPHKGETLIILLALADWSNDEGVSWPSMVVLAKKARITEPAARRIIRRLEESGALIVERGGGAGNSNRYTIKPIPKVPLVEKRKGNPTSTKGEPYVPLYKEEPSKEPPSSPSGDQFSLNGNPKPRSRFIEFRELLETYWNKANPNLKMPFEAADGKQLSEFLKGNPHLQLRGDHSFYSILLNRYNSQDVVHSTPIHRWIRNCMIYINTPLDRFNRPLEEKD